LKVGRLTERIALERNNPTHNDWGESTDNWEVFDAIWADVHLETKDSQQNETVAQGSVYTIWIRHHRQLNTHHRIRWRDRVLWVNEIGFDPRKDWMRVIAGETKYA